MSSVIYLNFAIVRFARWARVDLFEIMKGFFIFLLHMKDIDLTLTSHTASQGCCEDEII